MLRATAITVTLAAGDLQTALQEQAAGRAENVRVELMDGRVAVHLEAVSEKLPFKVPVSIVLRPALVRESQVVAAVEIANFGFVPGFLKEMALQRALASLPGEYRDGLLTVDAADLLDQTPVRFRLDSLQIDPGGLTLVLKDVEMFPFEPTALVVEATPMPLPAPGPEVALEEPAKADFYHKLRDRIRSYSQEKAPGWMRPLLPWVMAVPDFFALMVRLARDSRVPPLAKVIAGATVAYFITPIDLIPDLLPFAGHVDDVAVALFAIEEMVRRVPPEVVQEQWPGDGQVLELASEGTKLFGRVLPARMLTAIRRLVQRT